MKSVTAQTFQNVKQKIIGKSERQNTAENPCQTVQYCTPVARHAEMIKTEDMQTDSAD